MIFRSCLTVSIILSLSVYSVVITATCEDKLGRFVVDPWNKTKKFSCQNGLVQVRLCERFYLFKQNCPIMCRSPECSPTKTPTNSPSKLPTNPPTKSPSNSPTKPTISPTNSPTKPTIRPTNVPTKTPTKMPTKTPSKGPTKIPTETPSKAPTKTPSKAPTMIPTKMPTNVPTKTPSKAPTNVPTKTPTKAPVETIYCDIGVHLWFPEGTTLYKGFHSDHMQLSSTDPKNSDNQVCKKGQSTRWCTFVDDGNYYGYVDVNKKKEREYEGEQWALIRSAMGSKFNILVQHYFDSSLEGASQDHKIKSTLDIEVNGHVNWSFRHGKDVSIDTHQENGDINFDYKGAYFVDVNCNKKCGCTANRRYPTCQVHAQLYYNKWEINNIVLPDAGFRSDNIRIFKENDDRNQWCGIFNTAAPWGCTHSGDAFFSYSPDTQELTNEKALVDIRDAADSTFSMYVNHSFNSETHQKIPPNLRVYVNGDQKFKHTFRDVKHVNSHLQDGRVNKKYPGSSITTMTCNSDCECEFSDIEKQTCRIYANLKYPTFEEAKFGVHTDILTASLDGNEEVCNSKVTGRTSWDCIHSGAGSAFIENWQYDYYYDMHSQQTMDIFGAEGKSFAIRSWHIFYKDVDYYDDDAYTNMHATLEIYTNDEILFTGDHANKKQLTVKVKCNQECECTIQK